MHTVFKTADPAVLATHRRNLRTQKQAQERRSRVEAKTERIVAITEYPQGWCATGLMPRDQADRDSPPRGMLYDPARDVLIPSDARGGVGAELRTLSWEREPLEGTRQAFQALPVPYGNPATLTESTMEVEINEAVWLAVPAEFARMVTAPVWEPSSWDALEREAQAVTASDDGR